MIIYGIKIDSDIVLPIDIPENIVSRYSVELSLALPGKLKSEVSSRFPFYTSHGRRVYLSSAGDIDGCERGAPWCYEVEDVVSFFWIGGERTIYYEMGKHGDANLLNFWFTHLFLPLFCTLEGMYDFLHAGAIEIAGKPILFIAPSMGGKSTLTNHFILRDHVLVSDDKVPTFVEDEKFMVAGSHPYHRPYRKFEELGFRVDSFIKDFKPIHAFYALEGVAADGDITINEINGAEKFRTLLPNYLYMFSFLREQRLQYLSSMLNQIKVFKITIPWDMKRLEEVRIAICTHCSGIK